MEFIQEPEELVYDASVDAMVRWFNCVIHFCTDFGGGGQCMVRVCNGRLCGIDV